MKKNLVTAAATAGLMLTAFGASANAQENTYSVQPGDSLWKISKTNNVSINNLKDWNNLSNDTIFVDQKLSLTYTVKSGDSLWAIARSYGTTVKELKNTNGLTSELILIGQQLKIPASNFTGSSTLVRTSTDYEATSYVVKNGDSLSAIGAHHHLTVSKLKSLNNLKSDTIKVGKSLTLSAQPNTEVSAASYSEQAPATTPKAQTDVSVHTEKTAGSHTSQTTNQTTYHSTDSASSQTDKQTAPAPSKPVENTTVSTSQTADSNASQAVQQPEAASTANVQAVINEAEKYIGTPYSWGGNTPAGFDCSGFTKYIFAKFGVSLPRTTESQYSATTPVSSPSVGDLVFFQTYKLGPSHVGIYLGNNKFISAASSGVTISDLTSTYWSSRYLGARRAF